MSALLLLGGCSSGEQRAAAAADAAQEALAAGRPQVARALIQRALSERDDVGDYWRLLAQIDLADKDLMGAFSAYQNVLSFDRGNIEALTRLCQIAMTIDRPERAEQYAEQLSQLTSDPTLVDTVRAGIAFARGRKDEASRLLGGVLQAHPNDLTALVVQGRMLEAGGDHAGAARSIERSLVAVGNEPASRLELLLRYYKAARDRDGYGRTVMRMARAQPRDSASQLALADLLYENGDRDGGLRVVQAVMARHPDDVATAAAIVNLWLAAGPNAVSDGALLAGANGASIEMKAAYAQYAVETGRVALALSMLRGIDSGVGPESAANIDARATLAYARALRDGSPDARAALDAMVATDPQQPRVRLARGRLRALAGDRAGAIEDLRQAVANDPGNVAARIDLAGLLAGNNDAVIAETVLRQGLDVSGDPRLALRLAGLMSANGRGAGVPAMLTDYARDNPLSLRAQRLASGQSLPGSPELAGTAG